MQPKLWHHHFSHPDWLSSLQPQMLGWNREAVQRGLCSSTQGWLFWTGKTQEKGRTGVHITHSIRLLSFAICVCVFVCVLCVQGSGRRGHCHHSPPAARLLSPGETRQPDLFCFLLEKRVNRQQCFYFVGSVFPLWILFSYAHIYVSWSSWNAEKGWSVGCRMALYKDVSVRKTSLNLVTGFFQYLRGKWDSMLKVWRWSPSLNLSSRCSNTASMHLCCRAHLFAFLHRASPVHQPWNICLWVTDVLCSLYSFRSASLNTWWLSVFLRVDV